MSSKNALRWLVVLGILGGVGSFGIYWLSLPRQGGELVCPPKPRHKADFAVTSDLEFLRMIGIDATAEAAMQAEEFGNLVHDWDSDYRLYVGPRYDFQEVLDYLNSWDDCYGFGRTEAEATPTPTATPELDVNGWIEWLTSQWHFTPDLDDWLLIDWPDSIIITDALSQTIVIQGPATVRFNDETTVPTPARQTDPGSLDLSPSRPDLTDGGLDIGRICCPPCRCPPKYKSSLDDTVVPAPSASIDGECADGASQ